MSAGTMSSQLGITPAALTPQTPESQGVTRTNGDVPAPGAGVDGAPRPAPIEFPDASTGDGASSDPGGGQPQGQGAGEAVKPDAAAEKRAQELAQRLVEDVLKPHVKLEISRSEESGNFTYRTVDDRTGEVLREWPQEQLVDELGGEDALAALIVDRTV